jgi:hypothetical protein
MRLLPTVIVAVVTLLLSGCATPALWEEGRFARYHEAADVSNLRLFQSKDGSDILVEYDEMRDGSDRIWHRGYWLTPNLERLADRRKPRFAHAEPSKGLESIAIFSSPGPLVPPAGGGSYAVVSTNGRAFTIWGSDKRKDEYELPVYRDVSGRVKQVLLTPAAITADVTILGAVAAYYSLPASWTALNCAAH